MIFISINVSLINDIMRKCEPKRNWIRVRLIFPNVIYEVAF